MLPGKRRVEKCLDELLSITLGTLSNTFHTLLHTHFRLYTHVFSFTFSDGGFDETLSAIKRDGSLKEVFQFLPDNWTVGLGVNGRTGSLG